MKKKIIKITIGILFILFLMLIEYRFIMHNIIPYRGEGGTVYLEIFGYTDTYYADEISTTDYAEN